MKKGDENEKKKSVTKMQSKIKMVSHFGDACTQTKNV